MLYRIESEKIHTQAVEFAASDHCNLRCAGCSHMSPFIRPRLAIEDELTRDMGRLATAMYAEEIRILGGEPLLNPRIVPILKAARASGVAKRVVVATNGLLLHRMSKDFWASVDEVRLNLYPNVRPSDRLIEQARQHATESGTKIVISQYSSFRVTLVTEPHPPDPITTMIFRTCKNAHLYHCHMVHAGWLYKCACPPYLGEFLKDTPGSCYQAEHDGFDIHGATDLRTQLWEYLTNSTPLDACRHCLGYVGEKQPHHQLTLQDTRNMKSRPIKRATHLSKKALTKDSLKYLGRRVSEALTGKPRW